MNTSNKIGQMFVCKDFFLLFFRDREEAQEYSTRYMGDDFFLTLDEANYELGDYMFSGGQTIFVDVYRPSDPILLIDIEDVGQKLWKQEKIICNVIWGEKIGWIPLHYKSFDEYFTRL